MDNTPQQLLALGKRLRAELEAIKNKLSEFSVFIRDLIQQQKDSHREQAEAKEKSINEPRPVIASLNTPVAIRVEAETNERKSTWQKIFNGLEILGILAVILYAVVTYNMWREMINATEVSAQAVHEARISRLQAEKSLRATIDQFRLDQRAWIGPADFYRSYSAEGDAWRFIYKINVKNTGKTPARNLTVQVMASVQDMKEAPPTWDKLKALERQADERLKRELNERGIKVNPPFHPSLADNVVKTEILGPNELREIPLLNEFFSHERLTRPTGRVIPAVQYILIHVEYNDIFSLDRRLTTLCFVYFEPQEVKVCASGNSMN